jgi:hypothetical protein
VRCEYSPKKVRTQAIRVFGRRGGVAAVEYREIKAAAARISLLAAKLKWMI